MIGFTYSKSYNNKVPKSHYCYGYIYTLCHKFPKDTLFTTVIYNVTMVQVFQRLTAYYCYIMTRLPKLTTAIMLQVFHKDTLLTTVIYNVTMTRLPKLQCYKFSKDILL